MEVQSDKEYHRKALALLVCFFIAFMYVETVLKPHLQGNQPVAPQSSSGTTDSQSTVTATPQGQTPLGQSTPGQLAPSQLAGQTQQLGEPGTAPGAAAGQPTPVGFPADSQVAQAGAVVVKTGALKARFSLLGGRLTELALTEYRDSQESGAPGLNLVEHTEQAPYPMGVYSGQLNDAWVNYRVVSGGANPSAGAETFVEVAPGGTEDLVLEGVLSDGRTIRKSFSFQHEGYFIDFAIVLSAASADGKGLEVEWTRFVPQDESSMFDQAGTEFAWFDGEKARRKKVSDLEEASFAFGSAKWVSIADKYFMAALIDKAATAQSSAQKFGQTYTTRLAGTPTEAAFSLFAGPKLYDGLKKAGYELQRNVDFGILGMISAPLLELLHFFYGLFGNYGLAIVTLTILVRLALYPLNSASFKQMKKMQDLKPEMDKVREQFKDKQEQQMQLMALYKKHGVNPVGGCLPMVLQMPIFFGLYWALMLAVELRHAPYALWITDLSAPEKLKIAGLSVPVMVILFVISMVVQQWTTPSQMDPTQKKVMMFMPVALGFMFASFPSGLTLYWLTSNLISIGQQKGLYHAHDGGKASALKITLSVSVVVFILAYIVTLL